LLDQIIETLKTENCGIVEKNGGIFGINPCDKVNCSMWRSDTGFILLHSFTFYFACERIPYKNNIYTIVNLNNINGKKCLETLTLSLSVFITTFQVVKYAWKAASVSKTVTVVIPGIY
jgi:hypothetical protein